MTQLEPPSDRVIVRPHDPESERNGILLPEIAQEASQYATVLAVGEGLYFPEGGQDKRVPLGVHADGPDELRILCPGDVVVMPRFNGTEIDYDGETVVSILASELLAVVT